MSAASSLRAALPSPLVSASSLAARLEDPRVVVADTRWYLTEKRGADEFARGHIPGAAFVDGDAELASAPGPDRPGRHPLPSAAQMSVLLSRLGVGADSIVVAYDDSGGSVAARLWWLLRYFGHGGGRVLDGGIQAWNESRYPLETTVRSRTPAPPLKLVPHPEMVVDKQRVAELSRSPSAAVLDARSAERFEGIVEPIDPRAGHIPGAKSAPFVDNLVGPEGVFRAPADLAGRYSALGAMAAQTIVAYCGSGVTACHDLLALALAGRPDALLYEGSWSDWSRDSAREAAQGKT